MLTVDTLMMQDINYRRLAPVVKSCWINAPEALVEHHRSNSAWIIEYVNIFLACKGYNPYKHDWTVLRLSKRYIEYLFDVLPAIELIKQRERLTDTDIALMSGYKSVISYRNCNNPKKLKEWIRGYNSCYNRLIFKSA